MSVCLHRYFSHKGFKCGRVTQFALYIGGCLASQVRRKRPSSPRFTFTPAADVSRATTDAGRRRGIETRRGKRGGGLALHVRAGASEPLPRRALPPPRARLPRVRQGFVQRQAVPRSAPKPRKNLSARGTVTNETHFSDRRRQLDGEKVVSDDSSSPPLFLSLCLLSDHRCRARLFGGRASTGATTRTATRRRIRTRRWRSASCTRGWGGCTRPRARVRSGRATTRSTCRTTSRFPSWRSWRTSAGCPCSPCTPGSTQV